VAAGDISAPMPAVSIIPRMVRVMIEAGSKRTFACALDWPGWCRSGKTEEQALATLAAYAPRYAAVAREAGLTLPEGDGFEVVERLSGDGTTDFGAPAAIAAADHAPLSPPEADRLARLLEAAWTALDRVVAGAPAELRKGPRGGGRDRDRIVDHVRGAEEVYARRLGLVGHASRTEIASALRSGLEGRWPPRYAARRLAWHVLDHAWEIADRSSG
jgi:hypothetical protein